MTCMPTIPGHGYYLNSLQTLTFPCIAGSEEKAPERKIKLPDSYPSSFTEDSLAARNTSKD